MIYLESFASCQILDKSFLTSEFNWNLCSTRVLKKIVSVNGFWMKSKIRWNSQKFCFHDLNLFEIIEQTKSPKKHFLWSVFNEVINQTKIRFFIQIFKKLHHERIISEVNSLKKKLQLQPFTLASSFRHFNFQNQNLKLKQ